MVKVIGWGKTQQQTDWRGRVFSALTRRLVCHLHRDSFFCTAITCGADFLSLNSPLPPSKPSSQSFCDNSNPLLHCPSSSSPSLQSLPRCLLLSKCSFFFHSSVLPPSQWHATVLRSKSRPRSQTRARKMSLAARLIRADSHGLKCHAFPAHASRRAEHWRTAGKYTSPPPLPSQVVCLLPHSAFMQMMMN